MNYTITIDTTGWTQQQVNMTGAMLVEICRLNGIAVESIIGHDGSYELNADADPTSFCTRDTVAATYATAEAAWAAAAQANAAETAADASRRNLLSTLQDLKASLEADVGELTLAQVQGWKAGIDAVTNIATWKVYEKRRVLFDLQRDILFLKLWDRMTG